MRLARAAVSVTLGSMKLRFSPFPSVPVFGLLLAAAAMSFSACAERASQAAAGAPAGASAQSAEAGPAVWLTDYEEALRVAAEEGKPVLMNFTGSDWCPPCKMLKRDVFSTGDFARYASDELVLLELDFPMQTQQPAELARQNQSLQEKFSVEAFPTLILLDSAGKETRRTVGYMEGGPKAFIAWIQG